MAAIPALCPNGHLFTVPNFIGGSVQGLRMSGNTTTCPRCGARAAMADGEFDMQDDVLTFVTGPEWSRQLIEYFRIQIRENPPTSAEALAQELADSGDPLMIRLAQWVREHRDALVIGVLLAVVSVVLQVAADRLMHADDNISPREMDQIIERAEQRGEERAERNDAQQPPDDGAGPGDYSNEEPGGARDARGPGEPEAGDAQPPT